MVDNSWTHRPRNACQAWVQRFFSYDECACQCISLSLVCSGRLPIRRLSWTTCDSNIRYSLLTYNIHITRETHHLGSQIGSFLFTNRHLTSSKSEASDRPFLFEECSLLYGRACAAESISAKSTNVPTKLLLLIPILLWLNLLASAKTSAKESSVNCIEKMYLKRGNLKMTYK